MTESQGAERATLPSDGFISQRQLLKLVPFSAETLRRRIIDRSFPSPVRISPRLNGWSVRAVREWFADMEAKAQEGVARHGAGRAFDGR